ncbi:alpha/beta fold hydrolase [Pelagibius sp. Alg239-R121]|uniref:alpha/beta fold hydrolase n=1 Tax=Pelagibius sp. Alg239-R121 TaxID=2993448 RepID=UPI0024A6371F|nr:alpha/beta fold hydrolase [Pelagibius sp. Alg239-R121]
MASASKLDEVALERGHLEVGDGHRIAWSVRGPQDGIPVVLLHGGPGSGSADELHDIFVDPLFEGTCFRSVLFDQRGCGKSEPLGSIEANTTGDLIADMEQLRTMFGFERWFVAGGSWGTTLALRYAVAHPERCHAVLLRAITVWSDEKFVWALEGRRNINETAWRALSDFAGASDWRSILDSYHKAAFGLDVERAIEAVRIWVAYENSFGSTEPGDFATTYAGIDPEAAMIKAQIGLHYWKHRAFLPAAQGRDGLFTDVDRLAAIPIAIVHGTQDHICHPDFLTAWRTALPQVRIEMVPGAGHGLEHPGLKQAFRQIIADAVAAYSTNR